MKYDSRYLKGIEEFNRHNYFQAHEIWEDLWVGERGPEREFYQGLIQAAVALHHLSRGNLRGARTLWERSRAYLTPYGPRYLGVGLEALLIAMSSLFERLTDADADRFVIDSTIVPQIRLDPRP